MTALTTAVKFTGTKRIGAARGRGGGGRGWGGEELPFSGHRVSVWEGEKGSRDGW